MKKYRGSIRKELTKLIIIIVSISLFTGYLFFVFLQLNEQRENGIKLSESISKMVSQDAVKMLFLNEVSVASDLTKKLKSFKDLKALVIYKKDKTPVFVYGKIKDIPHLKFKCVGKYEVTGDIFEDTEKLYYEKNFIAYIKFFVKVESFWEIFFENIFALIILLLLLIFISYLLSIKYAKSFTEPIIKLVEFLDDIESEKFLKRRIAIEQDNEYGRLYDEVNEMLQRLEESYKELRIASVAFETDSAMLITDKSGVILDVNDAFEKITGYSKSEIKGKRPSILKSNLHSKEFYKHLYEELSRNRIYYGEITNRKKDGSLYTERILIQSVLDDNEEVEYYVASFRDVTRQKLLEKRLEELEHYDKLTGLPNRRYIKERLQNDLDLTKVGSVVCLAVNIENFKMINEAYGFEFANKILQEIAKRLKKVFIKNIARVGADEFFVYIKIEKEANFEAKIEAQKVIEVINDKPFEIDGTRLSITSHIGISVYDSKQDSQTLINEAVTAVGIARKNELSVSFYDKKYQELSLKHLDLYSRMVTAIKEEQFELFYQLQNDRSGKVLGAEALIRWRDPSRGYIAPFEFIPLLEKSELILKLTPWIIKTACRQINLWQNDEVKRGWSISINISAKEFEDELFISYIKDALKEYHIAEGLLKVELLESSIAKDRGSIVKKMIELHKLGVKVSLDDFGTGYSSLSYLKELPIDQIKIDQVFVRNILNSNQDLAIVKSIILLGKAFGLNIIVEGVETKEEFELLSDLGCENFQGFYFYKPKPISEI